MARPKYLSSETKLSILIMLLTAYIFSPAAFWFYLSYELQAGSFPVNADSIGLPMGGFLILWFIGWILMIVAAFTLAIYRRAFGTNALD